MFGLHPNEVIFTVLLAVLIFGPKKLPELARGVGQAIREFRQVTSEPLAPPAVPASPKQNVEPPLSSEEDGPSPA